MTRQYEPKGAYKLKCIQLIFTELCFLLIPTKNLISPYWFDEIFLMYYIFFSLKKSQRFIDINDKTFSIV